MQSRVAYAVGIDSSMLRSLAERFNELGASP
jgi:hypothetical protein